jgi:hypothetical protein
MAADSEIDSLIRITRAKLDGKDWNVAKEVLPESLAAIFAVWSVTASKAFFQESKNMDTVLRPHPIQVWFIFINLFGM